MWVPSAVAFPLGRFWPLPAASSCSTSDIHYRLWWTCHRTEWTWMGAGSLHTLISGEAYSQLLPLRSKVREFTEHRSYGCLTELHACLTGRGGQSRGVGGHRAWGLSSCSGAGPLFHRRQSWAFVSQVLITGPGFMTEKYIFSLQLKMCCKEFGFQISL